MNSRLGSYQQQAYQSISVEEAPCISLQILTSYFLLLPLREDAGISLGRFC